MFFMLMIKMNISADATKKLVVLPSSNNTSSEGILVAAHCVHELFLRFLDNGVHCCFFTLKLFNDTPK